MKIDTNEIHLWLTCQDSITDKALINHYQTLLSADETKRVTSFAFRRHQHQALVTRALLRHVLSIYHPMIHPKNWAFTENEFGKPFIKNTNQPFQLYFNLSHTDKLISLAITRHSMIGIDVEFSHPVTDLLDIAKRHFSRSEYNMLANIPVAKHDDYFYYLWTLKESYIKARGMGLSIPLDQFAFRFPNEEAVDFTANFAEKVSDWQFWQLAPSSQHVMALSSRLPDYKDRCSITSIKQIVPGEGYENISCRLIRASGNVNHCLA